MQEDGQGPNEDVYVYAEKEAALLGWVWGLSCPVINRYPPELWFERIESLEFWRGRLERFGLELTAVGVEQTASCYSVAVIGSQVIWDQGAPQRLECTNDSLIKFAKSLGLSYLVCRITDSSDKPKISGVEPFPTYDGFCVPSRREIVTELIRLITASKSEVSSRTATDSWF